MIIDHAWIITSDLHRTKTVVLQHRDGKPRYELHLDSCTTALLRHAGFVPELRRSRCDGPLVVFVSPHERRRRFEWDPDFGTYQWVEFRVVHRSLRAAQARDGPQESHDLDPGA